MENVFKACIRTAYVGTGLSVAVGPWTLIPIFAGVSFDKIGYGNWVGRILGWFSLYKYFSTKELPSLFPYLNLSVAFLGISLVLLLRPNPESIMSEIVHGTVAMILTVLFGGMALLLNQKIKRESVIV